ncbi:MAG: response regulator [Deltaproteobacteria bacterium]|nr:response regulator [Deltaproteobacteria bacterium]
MNDTTHTILIVDDDELTLRAITRQLSKTNMRILTAKTLSEALPILLASRVDVLLTDLRLEIGEGTELLWVVQNNALPTRCLLMSGQAGPEEERLAFELGAMTVLEKPFKEDELLAAIKRALDPPDGFSGDLCCVTLIDVLQMYHLSKRSVVIELAGPSLTKIFMEHGQVVHAVHGARTGEEAFRHILKATHGRLRTAALATAPRRTIDRRFDSLLLDGLRINDEENATLQLTA